MTAKRLKFTLTFTLILLLTYSQLYASPSDSANPPQEFGAAGPAPSGDTVMAHGEAVILSYVSVIDGFTLSECSITLTDNRLINVKTSVVEKSGFSGWKVHAGTIHTDYFFTLLRGGQIIPHLFNARKLGYQIICSKNSGSVKTYPPGHTF